MMFKLFNKNHAGETITLEIEGMHCSSCSMNIDGELEDTEGVIRADTSFAKSQTKVEYNPALIDAAKLRKVIESLGYFVKD